MARLIITLGLLVILALFIGLNFSYRTTVNVFGWKLQDAPSIIVILASFIAGILLSLSLYFLRFLSKRSRRRLQERIDAARKKEEELAGRERTLQAQATADAALPPPAVPTAARPVSPLGAWLRGRTRRPPQRPG